MRGDPLIRAAAAAVLALAGSCGPTRTVGVAEKDLPTAGARRPEFFRKPGPRKDETIFSALDLPAPNSVRTAAGIPGPDYWQQQVNYSIDATLDAEKKAITGREVVTYINNSPD